MNVKVIWTVIGAIEQALAVTWPILIICGIVIFVPATFRLFVRRRLQKSGIEATDQMSQNGFDRRLASLFRNLGYRVKRLHATGERGVNLIISKDGEKAAVQTRLVSNDVGLTALEEVVAAKVHFRCTTAMIVTNDWFTDPAERLAVQLGVELWDRHRLIDELLAERKYLGTRRIALAWNVGLLMLVLGCGAGWYSTTHAARQLEVPRVADAASATPAGAGQSTIPPAATGPPVTPAGERARTDRCGQATVEGVASLRIRSAPGKNSQVIASRVAGTRVDLLCDAPVTADGVSWRRVRTGDIEGWMSTQFLK